MTPVTGPPQALPSHTITEQDHVSHLSLRPGRHGGSRGDTERHESQLGADAYVYVYGKLPDDTSDDKNFVARFDGRVPPRIGDMLTLEVRTSEEHAFHPETGERLG